MAGTVTHYAKIPSAEELCFVVANIDLKEIKDSSAKSHFHWKTMKCRLIIHTMQNAVIACPAFETVSSIHVIVGVEFFKTRLLQNSLQEMNMTWSAPRPVTPDVYANCLRYSILFVIAPRWNVAGQYLINDKQFLTAMESNTAVRFNLTVASRYEKKNAEVCLRLQPLKLRLCNVTLEGLGLPHEVIGHFMADPDGMIDITFFGAHRVTVLPSLKRGKLMAALKKIPASSPFKSYDELKRHWKNMYGYRLPETDYGLIYFSVYFPMPGTDYFLYPSVCVRSQIVETPYFGNRGLLVESFLRDIQEAQPMICGISLRIVGDSGKQENSSVAIASSSREADGPVKEDPKTPEPMAKCEQSTTRLSMSCLTPRNQLRRDSSSLMSPTPSLRGALTIDETRPEKVRGVLSTIARFREIASSAHFSRVKENPSETQNQCPNVENSEEKTKPNEAIKSSPMEFESDEPRVFLPRSNFAESSREETSIIGKPLNSSHGNNVKPKIESSEIVSKYFQVPETPDEKPERAVSGRSTKLTLREKLLRNMTWDEKMTDDYE